MGLGTSLIPNSFLNTASTDHLHLTDCKLPPIANIVINLHEIKNIFRICTCTHIVPYTVKALYMYMYNVMYLYIYDLVCEPEPVRVY